MTLDSGLDSGLWTFWYMIHNISRSTRILSGIKNLSFVALLNTTPQ
jgi:hypothetical protein